MSAVLRLRSLRALVFRCPIDLPVVTSFGAMRDRPMVLLRAEDDAGAVGWGETWCNFPAVGAEHRARLVESVLWPLLAGKDFATPREAFQFLSEKTAVLAIQSGEPGPIAQSIAGTDIALWDLAARKAGQPLWRLLGGELPHVRVYASGLNPESPERLALSKRNEGYTAFKLKIGFGDERDFANLKALRAALGEDAELMVDANQAWSLDAARQAAPKLAGFGVKWLEEPLRADRPWGEWRALANECPVPLAAGENLAGEAAFDGALSAAALGVVQPDIAKWGGFSGCLPVARKVLASGRRFCPHYLGGGVGLLASAHLLAAAGGGGMLEMDANENPLRTLTCGPLAAVSGGRASLGEAPGLGAEPQLEALARYAATFS
ncbi:MAG: mandelate racemase/muconate lactonizing enzyme family protein [Burkholderiales bacterium]|nr:mandelate racemase/muconate lactonizing enzyme family protein [Burkholderiales bacterium]